MSFKIDDILNCNKSTSSSSSSVSSCSPIGVENLINLPNRNYFPFYQTAYPQFDFLKSNFFNQNLGKREENSENNVEQPDPLKLVSTYAKKIDELAENSNCKEAKKSNKIKSIRKKKEKIENKCDSCSGNCADIACSISSVLPMEKSQLPMCLRSSNEDQLHLASLFNTLMHHKKCRRTRTVFSDMQLIGLEKRFENQKYLSTPDRIQLADSLGLSQLQVKTWYQNRRMKWKKKVLKEGCHEAPTKPKGRPKKNSIPSLSEILAAAEAAENGKNSCGSNISEESIDMDDYSSDSDMDEIDVEEDSDGDEYFQESFEGLSESAKSSIQSDN
ncbi:unnamed protein product [Brachionus calyciflorus]|uniref:Homeobox domain-containing protein n=1 Tax=Brachionus calyciflorus TaxID=104777 RepID=A0A814KVD5_9BILA|nr:unnamed protein product [Brachionus calyciflorus]